MGIDYKDTREGLQTAQDVETDLRQRARDADDFINLPQGQWEPDIWERFRGKPRYTFDECTPVVDQVVKDVFSMDFEPVVRPSSGTAVKEVADTYQGIIRNLDSVSGAKHIYRAALKETVTCGMSGWRLATAWSDPLSFHQDILTVPICNFRDRVWFDVGAELPDASDADTAWLLTALARADYDRDFPKGSGLSVSQEKQADRVDNKAEQVVVGEALYKVEESVEIALMSNGSVYLIDEKFQQISDELTRAGLSIQDTRETTKVRIAQRFFDGGDWLTDEAITIFQWIPIIPLYGNFGVTEDKIRYRGEVEKIMDPQRVLNYSESRKTEETSLAPRSKLMMAKKQATSTDVRADLQTMNTNTKPVQFYDHVPEIPIPFQLPGPTGNPALVQTTESMERRINRTSGKFEEARGQATNVQSGIAIKRLQDQSKSGDNKYFEALEIALRHTQRIRVQAIPELYNNGRQTRLLNQDGSTEMVTLNEQILDKQTNQAVEINDLSQGLYDVTISIGPAYDDQQQDTVAAITELAAIYPAISDMGADVLLGNVNRPGISTIAERVRLQMLNSGKIPPAQQTDDEKKLLAEVQKLREQQSQKQPSPIEQAALETAQAEKGVAQAELERSQANTAEILSKITDRKQNTALKAGKFALDEQNQMLQNRLDQQGQALAALTARIDARNTEADTLGKIKQAMGADAIIGPGNTAAYENQTEVLQRSQTRLPRR